MEFVLPKINFERFNRSRCIRLMSSSQETDSYHDATNWCRSANHKTEATRGKLPGGIPNVSDPAEEALPDAENVEQGE